jgi:hypothetical protein
MDLAVCALDDRLARRVAEFAVAFRREQLRSRATDAATRARDNSDFSIESSHVDLH